MDYIIPFNRLTTEHEFLPFDCGDEDLNNYLITDALHYQEQLLSVTYYLENENETILFFSLSNDKIAAMELNNNFWRKIKNLFPHSKHRKDYPAVKIGRLGVNVNYQHQEKSWGSFILNYIKQWMITENKTGCHYFYWCIRNSCKNVCDRKWKYSYTGNYAFDIFIGFRWSLRRGNQY